MALDLKSFKDVNGKKVVAGEYVSVVGKNEKAFPSIYRVKNIARSQRDIDVCVYDAVANFHYYFVSRELHSEEN